MNPLEFIGLILTPSVAAATLRLATPYLFAAIGETFGQRSGLLNLGVDGIMLMGAFFAFYGVYITGSLLVGIAAAILIGSLLGFAMAFISVTMKAKQGISGIGMYLFGLGMSELLFQKLIGTPRSVVGFPGIYIPVLSDLPLIGQVLFRQNLLVYAAFASVPIAWFIFNRTTYGLKIRAVGQNPAAADAMDVSVVRIRYSAEIIGGALAGIAGASLSIGLLNVFQQNLTGGLGFIAVALVYFGRWKPVGVLAGALLFSFVNAVQLQISAVGIAIPPEFSTMAPYVITIIALMFAGRQTEKPTALTVPFERGE